jgi:hypothetical protein
VSKLAFFNSVTGDGSKIPSYRVLDGLGIPIEGAEVPEACVFSSVPNRPIDVQVHPDQRTVCATIVGCLRNSPGFLAYIDLN